MLCTIILATALATQAPTTEQQRQAELKALAAKIHQENVAKKAQAKPKPATPKPPLVPVYQFVEVPQVEVRSLLYLWTEGLSEIPIFADRSQVRAMEKALLADDDAAVDAYVAKTRLPAVPIGTAVRVTRVVERRLSETVSTRTFARELQAAQSSGTHFPACEVLVLDGPFKDKKGWVLETHLRNRVEINLEKKAKRRR